MQSFKSLKLTVGGLRILVAQAVGDAWEKMLKNPKFMKWTFTCQGLTLPLDGSKDSEMDLQCITKGIPEGMVVESPVSS